MKNKKIWTSHLKKRARKELLDLANCYEVRERQILRNVIFLNTGQARWIGAAHDYSVWIDQVTSK